MSYANSGSGRERIVAIGLVGLIQGGIIAALLSGLAVQFVTKIPETPLSTYDVPDDPPPPPPTMEPPKDVRPMEAIAIPQPKPFVPQPIVPTEARPVIVTTVDIQPQPTFDIVASKPAGQPAQPPVTDLSRTASTRGSVAEWFPRSEYPASALRAGAEGRVSVLLNVSSSGRATGCEVISGSGDSALDAATCRLALRNGRFEPARDAAGNKAATQMRLPPVAWRIEN